jgi:maltooligosyltrehalose trehalohydrolase
MAAEPGLWGPRLLDAGVEFRLWAPSVNAVDLLIDRGGADGRGATAMHRVDGGWWRLTVAEAGPGTRYAYRLPGGLEVPDPASRFQPDDVHGRSQVVDAGSYDWQDGDWAGLPWHDAVVYELHVGAFTREGTFRAAADKLDDLVALGVTAVELLPVADFPGARNWGYDGVLPFAPDSSYGTPDELRQFVDAAHARGLMVLLDVVYNHFGPDGNYLGTYAEPFFTDRHYTPWGDAINFDTGPHTAATRQFFIENALHWLEDYHFDGLRLDAVHAIYDDSPVHILTELADRVRRGPGASRPVHLVLENDDNESRWLRRDRGGYDAQWNDDLHHALHVTLTGQADSYYADYAERPLQHLLRALTEGFAYQGEVSPHRGHRRGEPSIGLPPSAFVAFLQNHDQVGNRAFGERIHELCPPAALAAATAVLLLSPMPPLLFMGQEWCATSRFPFFCDFSGELAQAVRDGRIREFERFEAFSDPEALRRIPDPVSTATFEAAKLRWQELDDPGHARWWRLHQELLAVRRRDLTPLLAGDDAGRSEGRLLGDQGLAVTWNLAGGARYHLRANLGDRALDLADGPPGLLVYGTPAALMNGVPRTLPPWSVVFSIERTDPAGAGGS